MCRAAARCLQCLKRLLNKLLCQLSCPCHLFLSTLIPLNPDRIPGRELVGRQPISSTCSMPSSRGTTCPSCLLCKNLFIQDYEGGSTQFCSSPLVHAMLAIAFSLINEDNDDKILPSGWLGSRLFYDEARRYLKSLTKPRDLPNIQALGMLSLYEIRCGREEQAMETAKEFHSGRTNLCHSQAQMTDLSNLTSNRVWARATSYCGAVSLIRYAIIY